MEPPASSSSSAPSSSLPPHSPLPATAPPASSSSSAPSSSLPPHSPLPATAPPASSSSSAPSSSLPPHSPLPAMAPPSSSSPPPPSPSLQQPDALPDEVWGHAFSFLPATADRNAAAAVCRHWLQAERRSRRRLAVRNCYATTPSHAVESFPSVRAAEVKGKPHFADFGVLPEDWGAFAAPWVEAAAPAPAQYGWPLLEELSFKRMVVSDECLHMIASSFTNFQVLRINKCDGFTSAGLAAITRGCRNLRDLVLQECPIEDFSGPCWLSNFPESFTSLETLDFCSLSWEVDLAALERLVSRCRNLKTLKLNNFIPLENVASLLCKAPQITELGTGGLSADYHPDLFMKVEAAFAGCRSLKRLSGAWGAAAPAYLPALYCVCEGLTSLNLFYATVQGPGLVDFISRCKNLLQLWVVDLIEDHGLSVVASTCSKLQELRVVPAMFFGYNGEQVYLTERGLVDVSAGCPMLESILYFCSRITNEALITVAKNRPNLTSFRFALLERRCPDYITRQPLDAGFVAIVESCRSLRRLSVSALLTDAGLRSIAAHASCLEVLSLAYTGDSDLGLHYLLSGSSERLKRLQATGCPFGDRALLTNAAKLEKMRYIWLSECKVTAVACRLLALKMPHLAVEVVNDPGEEPLDQLRFDCPIYKLYVYPTLAGPRSDAPECVQISVT